MPSVTSENALLWVLAICATTMTGLVVKREFTTRHDANVPQDAHVEQWQQYATRGHRFGPASSRATMIVFSDFQCPYCRGFANVVDSLHVRFPGLTIIERHFPLTNIHPAAYGAAMAAECAGDANKYEDMRHALFANTELVNEQLWGAVAARAGVADTSALVACVRSARHAVAIKQDMDAGTSAGVDGTPGVILNDTRFGRPPGMVSVESQIKEKLAAR